MTLPSSTRRSRTVIALGAAMLIATPVLVFSSPATAVVSGSTAEISDIVLGIGSTETERHLTWISSVDTAQEVQLVTSNRAKKGRFPANALTISATGAAATNGGFVRDVVIEGLRPKTSYSYRVGSDETGWSEVSTFTTGDRKDDFSFLLFGDPQIGASGDVAADAAGWADTLAVATKAVPEAEFLYSAGDQVETASDEIEYEAFLAPEQLRSLPLAVTNGNHDVGSTAYFDHFSVPNEDLSAGAASNPTASGGDYWFIYKDVLFVNINSNSRDQASHNAFMERVVAEHGDEARWKVLTFHHSIYSVASHTDDTDILDRRATMPTEISALGFDLVLMGHDHSYTRSYLIENGEVANATELAGQNEVVAEKGQVLYVTANSSSGSKYYNVKAPDAPFASVINQEKVRNYSVVDVTDDGITVRTLRSEVGPDGQAVNSEVDAVTLTRAAE